MLSKMEFKCHSPKNFRLYAAGIRFPRHTDQDEPPIPAKQDHTFQQGDTSRGSLDSVDMKTKVAFFREPGKGL